MKKIHFTLLTLLVAGTTILVADAGTSRKKIDGKAKAEALFNALDANQDGSLDIEEFAGEATRLPEADKAFATYDKDQDGKLTMAEFTLVPAQRPLGKGKSRQSDDEQDEEVDRPEPDSTSMERDEFGEEGVDY